jgi:hypothetical protein
LRGRAAEWANPPGLECGAAWKMMRPTAAKKLWREESGWLEGRLEGAWQWALGAR